MEYVSTKSRLNTCIKIFMIIGELIIMIISGLFVTISGLFLMGKIYSLNSLVARRSAFLFLAFSFMTFISTVFGLCGVVNQLNRRGLCSGRSLLLFHQITLLILILFILQQNGKLNNNIQGIDIVLKNNDQYSKYEPIEGEINQFFNDAYFEGICERKNEPFKIFNIFPWINTHCPKTMRNKNCFLTEKKKETCDTSCTILPWNEISCCPSKELCVGVKQHKACPYDQCRLPILSEVQSIIFISKKIFQFVQVLSAIMIILSCLLICYKPRDEIEIELLKTGVMTEQDVKTFRELKLENGSPNHQGEGRRHHSIDLDGIHEGTNSLNLKNGTSLRGSQLSTSQIHPASDFK